MINYMFIYCYICVFIYLYLCGNVSINKNMKKIKMKFS